MALHRYSSEANFQTHLHSHATEQLAEELDGLLASVTDAEDEFRMKQEFATYQGLFARHLAEAGKKIEWDAIEPPAEGLVQAFEDLAADIDLDPPSLLNKLAVLKLNGGLGTTMGCVGPKSAIEVRAGQTFLDLTVRQIEHLNKKYGVSVPLVLMNSFNTHEDTLKIIRKYDGLEGMTILTFNQSKMPRIYKETLSPVPETGDDPDKTHWYPPGHGDVYASLERSGILDRLREMGKEFVFLSNIDNLGATVSLPILDKIASSDGEIEFIMEVTDKTKADVKGGTIITYEGRSKLLEIAQVPADHVEDFKSIKKFKIFNTNSMWISLSAIKRLVNEDALLMDIIPNQKTLADGSSVLQLEQACGAAMEFFKGSIGINVPRSRFLPVKKTSDLLLVQSNLYDLISGSLILSPNRIGGPPVIKLGPEFSKMAGFASRIKDTPDLVELDHLTISGDVVLGKNISLRGTVIIVAGSGEHIDIPSGAVFENKIITGSLRVLDH